MATRTDHATQARVLLGNVTPDEMADADSTNWLLSAQVHATLALVEQQRIANLIAWTVGAGYSASPEVAAEIVAALHMPPTPKGPF